MTICRKLAAGALFLFLLAGCSGQSVPEAESTNGLNPGGPINAPSTAGSDTLAEPAATLVPKEEPRAEVAYRAQPPLPKVTAGTADIPVVQDSYCWGYLGCRDYAGGKVMYNGQPLLAVQPGEVIQIVLDYQPQPTTVNVTEIRDDHSNVDVPLSEGGFTAPTESGVYYYSYSANWMTEDGIYVINQTSAVFALEIL